MFEQFSHYLSKVSVPHLNVLLLLGIALFGGTIGGRIFQKLKIPQVVGYIVIGIAIGESGLRIVDSAIIKTLEPFSYFALGLVGFMIGGELKGDVLRKYGKQFTSILIFEGVTAFVVVSLFVGILGTLLFGNWRFSLALGLLLGAIASATAPATTTAVLREYKTRGPLTRTVLGIVALDDALALLLFAFASSIAGVLVGSGQQGLMQILINPLYAIGGSISLGILGGLVLKKLLRKYSEEDRLLTFSVGTILLTVGISLAIHVDMLLATMTLGAMVINFTPRKSKDVFKLVEIFTPPIYILFFVLVGARLNIHQMSMPIILLALAYLIGRSLGKSIGASVGARVSGAAKSIRKYLPLCLFSQAGVAIGLSILASHYFPGEMGNTIVIIVTATAFVLEIIGPALVKIAVTKAGEVGLNITEEDLLQRTKTEEMMDKNPPLIYKDTPLAKVLETFSTSTNLYYPVVDSRKKLLGIVSVDNIRNVFMAAGLSDLLLAVDFMEPAVDSVRPESLLISVKESIDRYNLEYMPVTTESGTVKGFIERRTLNKLISTKIIELQHRADLLEEAF